jgi:hypothetical protein
MNRVGKRSSSSKSLAQQKGHKKRLYLPMERTAADRIALPVRVALESIRRGHTERDVLVCLSEVVLMTGFLTEAGHSKLDQSMLDDVEKQLLATLDNAKSSNGTAVEPKLVEALTAIVNEYDRVLRESRFLAIVEANERLPTLTRSAVGARRQING